MGRAISSGNEIPTTTMERLLMYKKIALNIMSMETDFSTIVDCADGQQREFHFTRINSVAIYFHISVVDTDNKLYSATMARAETSQWQLQENDLPEWFKYIELKLADIIQQKACNLL